MNKKQVLIVSTLFLLPVFSFASTGDTTFDKLNTQLTGFLGGSLGMVFVLMGFLGAAASIAGFASMKVMFPVFGLTLALHYGPGILTTIFAATGDYTMTNTLYSSGFTLTDLLVVFAFAAMFVIAIDKSNCNKVKKAINE